MRKYTILFSLVAIVLARPDQQPSCYQSGGSSVADFIFDGEEFLIDTSIVYAFAPDYQWYPAIGFDGTNYLVVWQDHRNGYWDIYGTRVSVDGTILDPGGIVICGAPVDQMYPAIGFDGTNYLVVWQDYRSGVGYEIYGARVSPDGSVLDTAALLISRQASGTGAPGIGFDGTNYLVVWSEWRSGSGYDIYGKRIAPSGISVDSIAFCVSSARNSQSAPGISFDGTNYLVAWEDYRRDSIYSDIYGARVTPAGTVIDPVGIAISGYERGQCTPVVIFDETNYLVVWRYGAVNYDLCGAWVTPAGGVLERRLIVQQEGEQVSPELMVGRDGQVFLVYQGWTDTAASRSYHTVRIWGKLDIMTGRSEDQLVGEQQLPMVNGSVFRGMLWLPGLRCRVRGNVALVNISGQKVMDLVLGANNISHLAPGVYFIKTGANFLVAKVVVVR